MCGGCASANEEKRAALRSLNSARRLLSSTFLSHTRRVQLRALRTGMVFHFQLVPSGADGRQVWVPAEAPVRHSLFVAPAPPQQLSAVACQAPSSYGLLLPLPPPLSAASVLDASGATITLLTLVSECFPATAELSDATDDAHVRVSHKPLPHAPLAPQGTDVGQAALLSMADAAVATGLPALATLYPPDWGVLLLCRLGPGPLAATLLHAPPTPTSVGGAALTPRGRPSPCPCLFVPTRTTTTTTAAAAEDGEEDLSSFVPWGPASVYSVCAVRRNDYWGGGAGPRDAWLALRRRFVTGAARRLHPPSRDWDTLIDEALAGRWSVTCPPLALLASRLYAGAAPAAEAVLPVTTNTVTGVTTGGPRPPWEPRQPFRLAAGGAWQATLRERRVVAGPPRDVFFACDDGSFPEEEV